MTEKLVCSTCRRTVSNLRAARFKCPGCSKAEIVRCADCRANAVVYECGACSFKGPN